MTVELCRQVARDMGYLYAAVQAQLLLSWYVKRLSAPTDVHMQD